MPILIEICKIWKIRERVHSPLLRHLFQVHFRPYCPFFNCPKNNVPRLFEIYTGAVISIIHHDSSVHGGAVELWSSNSKPHLFKCTVKVGCVFPMVYCISIIKLVNFPCSRNHNCMLKWLNSLFNVVFESFYGFWHRRN